MAGKVFRLVKEMVEGRPRWVRKYGPGPPTWFIEYYNREGKQKRIATDAQTKTEAQMRLTKALSDNNTAELLGIPSESVGMTFGKFVQEIFLPYVKQMRAAGTYELYVAYAKTAEAAFGGLQLREITRGHVKKFVSDRMAHGKTIRKKALAPATVNREFSFVRAAFYHAYDQEMVEVNPCARVELQKEDNKRERTMSTDEEGKLMEKAPAWMHPIIQVAVLAGLRRGEILALKWRETAGPQDHYVDLKDGVIHISNESKNDKARDIPITPALRPILDRLPRGIREGKRVSWLFVDSTTGKPYEAHIIADHFNRTVRRARLVDLHFHDLRRTFASRLANEGVSLPIIAALLGHGATYVTERYAHPDEKAKKDAVGLLSKASTG
jgi:integrase